MTPKEERERKLAIENALLAAAYEADVRKVKEEGGDNRGKAVEEYQRAAKVGPGSAWCAAFVWWCLLKAGAIWVTVKVPARVSAWRDWGAANDRVVSTPERGDLGLYVNRDGTGHIWFIAEAKKIAGVWWMRTIEGNTNDDGSRNGYKVARRWRKKNSNVVVLRLR